MIHLQLFLNFKILNLNRVLKFFLVQEVAFKGIFLVQLLMPSTRKDSTLKFVSFESRTKTSAGTCCSRLRSMKSPVWKKI